MKTDENFNIVNQVTIESILGILEHRFNENMKRHKGIRWEDVSARLALDGKKLASLVEMEKTGGEPDIFEENINTGEFIFYDFSTESPAGRRNLCYDRKALESRKHHKPESNAADAAEKMGVEILSEKEYRNMQKLGEFDLKTSSWVKTPDDIRASGGALFCDRRYGHVFLYHNGAESYYSSRGFRALLRV